MVRSTHLETPCSSSVTRPRVTMMPIRQHLDTGACDASHSLHLPTVRRIFAHREVCAIVIIIIRIRRKSSAPARMPANNDVIKAFASD